MFETNRQLGRKGIKLMQYCVKKKIWWNGKYAFLKILQHRHLIVCVSFFLIDNLQIFYRQKMRLIFTEMLIKTEVNSCQQDISYRNSITDI